MQIHRFFDRIALYTSGPTVYLTPNEARSIAKQLTVYAKDVDTHKFGHGKAGTFEMPLTDPEFKSRENF